MALPASLLARDGLLAGVLTVVTQVELLLAAGEVEGPRWVQQVAFTVMTASVALRRVRPLLAALVIALGMAGQTLAGEAPVVGGFLALLVVAASLGYHAGLRSGVVGLAAIAMSATLYDFVAARFVLADFVGNMVIVGGGWGGARLLRSSTDRRVKAEVARDRAAREAVAAERNRIARDLHDSVAHALTLMTLQAGAARERAHGSVVETLGSIEREGRRALADMHRSLRLLGDVGDRVGESPGLKDLDDLLARVRASGLEVSASLVGELDDLPASVSSTAYCVVQEALTNAVKHSGAAHASVELKRSPHELTIEVRDDGAGPDGARAAIGSGSGLASLRERVSLFGGRLTAAPADESGWRLQATIPLQA